MIIEEKDLTHLLFIGQGKEPDEAKFCYTKSDEHV